MDPLRPASTGPGPTDAAAAGRDLDEGVGDDGRSGSDGTTSLMEWKRSRKSVQGGAALPRRRPPASQISAMKEHLVNTLRDLHTKGMTMMSVKIA